MTSYEKNHGCASRDTPDGVHATVTAHRCSASNTWSYAAWYRVPTIGPGVAVAVEVRLADRMGYGLLSKAEALEAGFAALCPAAQRSGEPSPVPLASVRVVDLLVDLLHDG